MKRNNNAPLIDESTPRKCQLIFWIGFGIAICSLLMLVVAGLGTRLGVWHFRTGLALFRYAAYGGVVATLATIAAIVFAFICRRKVEAGAVLVVGVMAITAVAVPYNWKRTADGMPRIHDISTDLNNPPRFVAILPFRKGADNSVEYGGAEVATKQQQAYPEIKPLILEIPAGQIFQQALATAQRMGWEIIAEAPTEGRIEATATTFWFGFKDDIVIRITPAGNRTRVDVRSLSRVGVSDVGTNARRILTYLRMLSSLLS